MKNKVLFVLLALVVLVAVGFIVFLQRAKNKDSLENETDTSVASRSADRDSKRTAQDAKIRLKRRLQEMRDKAESLKASSEAQTIAERARLNYAGRAKAVSDSALALDKILSNSDKNDALAVQLKKSIERRLSASNELKGVKMDSLNCNASFCRARFNYENIEGMRAFRSALGNGWAWNDRHHFVFARNKATIMSTADISNQSLLETSVYFSNGDDPLPIDEELQRTSQTNL